MFVASSTQKLVGIQYNWFLKCAFLQHDLFLKLLWQGFISSCAWLSPQGRCAEAKLGIWCGSQFGRSEKITLELPDVQRQPFLYNSFSQKVCALFVVGLKVPFSQKDELMLLFWGSSCCLCKQELRTGGSWKLWDSNPSSLSLQTLQVPVVSAWIPWGSVNPCILGTHMVNYYLKYYF